MMFGLSCGVPTYLDVQGTQRGRLHLQGLSLRDVQDLTALAPAACSAACPPHPAPCLQVLDWFGGFGYQIPFGVSVADFILDISLGEAGYSNSGATGNAAVKELYTAFETQYGGAAAAGNAAMQAGGFSTTTKQQQGSGRGTRMLPMSTIPSAGDVSSLDASPRASSAVAGPLKGAVSSDAQQQPRSGQRGGKDRAPYWEQLRVLLQRTARVRRFEQMTGQHFFQLFAVAFITGGCRLLKAFVQSM